MHFPDREDVAGLVEPLGMPGFARVRYEPATESVPDPADTTRSELGTLPVEDLDPGSTVAIGVGSRGIDDVERIVRATVETIAEMGYEPVIVPAMGSHGGASPEGQREVLAHLGITEESVGAPIDARMETTHLGTVTVGETDMPVYLSTAALEADAILVVNRVKPHTNFTGHVESGLIKMTVVGLGKQRGANAFHSTAIGEGYVETLEAALDPILESAPVLGGLATVENFDEETAHVEWIPAERFLEREPALLERARSEMAVLPVEDIDLLVVDEIGKDVSGAGMDTNVIGRYRVLNAPDPDTPDISLIYVRGLTETTDGNGIGIGLADLTRQSVVDELDLQQVYANAITSGSLSKAKLPVVAPDDDLAIRIAFGALGGYDPETVRVVWIENTQDLAELRVSTPVVEDLPEGAEVLGREQLSFQEGTASLEEV